MTIAGDFKHAPTPPNPALGGAAALGLLAEPTIPTFSRVHHVQRSYADVPGARTSTATLIEQDMVAALTPLYGPDAALRALGNLRWSQHAPRFPGDRALLTAEVTIVSRVDVIPPTGHQE